MPSWKFLEGTSIPASPSCRNWIASSNRTRSASCSRCTAPPGTPKDRTDILREAMRKIYADREFLAEYLKLTGEEASPLLPDANDKAIKELPRDHEVIESYKLLGSTQPLPPR